MKTNISVILLVLHKLLVCNTFSQQP